MTEKTAAKTKTRRAHTELRRQDADEKMPVRDDAETRLKPRTPTERLPLDSDEDDLFNDMPV